MAGGIRCLWEQIRESYKFAHNETKKGSYLSPATASLWIPLRGRIVGCRRNAKLIACVAVDPVYCCISEILRKGC